MLPIETILAQGESETLEFKPSFNQDVIETAVALANHSSVARPSCRTGFLGTPRSLCFWITTRSRVREARPTTINKYGVSIGKCSKPRNRLIAQAFYDMGMIEQYGSGIKRVVDGCLKAGLPEPEFENFSGGFQIVFRPVRQAASQVGEQVAPHVEAQDVQVGTKSEPSRHQVNILRICLEDSSLVDLMHIVGRSDRTKFRNQVLNPLLESDLIKMPIPNKPTSRLQKYRLTEKGKQFLREQKQ